MENLSKFSAAKSTTSDASACKSLETMTCVGGGGVGVGSSKTSAAMASGGGAVGGSGGLGIGGIGMVNATSSTPSVSSHTSTWLAALHVNNNNNNTEKMFNLKDNNHHICSSGIGGGTNTMLSSSSSKGVVSNMSAAWQCESCDMYQKNGSASLPRVALIEEDEGGGGNNVSKRSGRIAACGGGGVNKFSLPLNGSASKQTSAAAASQPHGNYDDDNDDSPEAAACALPMASSSSSFLHPETDYQSYDMRGAVSLSPPLMEDPFDEDSDAAAAAIGGGHSNRTSLNNSTENLSYTSDNFYGDDLILLGDDGDLDAEELSLNSDDCVYAYRGAGAEFDLPLPPISGLAGNFGLHQGNIAQEEETDFLEMDFDPDPPSELEYNHSAGSLAAEAKDQYLMQRDACHLVTPTTQRHQLFSSPIDDLLPPPPAPKALQAQSLLSKNFARITLHLDQIQKDYEDRDNDREDDGTRERLNSALDSRPLEEEFTKDGRSADTSHSLPNTLHEHFTNRCNSESAVISNSKDSSLAAPLQTLGHHIHHKSPSKITGAKPKRLSTFSSTSSTSSKNSSKSRNSLRSAYQATTMLGTSSSFDERSVSCSEFRTERDLTANNTHTSKQSASLLCSAPHTAAAAAAAAAAATTAVNNFNAEYNIFNDETCLDCLEKEFLANTIGKALDPFGCLKCRKRLGHLSMYNRAVTTTSLDHQQPQQQPHHHHHQQQQQQPLHQHQHHQQQHPQQHHTSKYRRSASPTTTFFYNDQTSPTSRLFSCEFLNSQARKRQEWDSFVQEHKETASTNTANAAASVLHSSSFEVAVADTTKSCRQLAVGDIRDLNQSLKNLESKLFKNLKPPDPCTVTISTINIMESSLVQALDKLQIASYDKELINAYFKKFSNNNNNNIHFSSSSANIYKTSTKEFKNLKDFLIYVSKRQGNYHKLKRLIGKLTTQNQQIIVQFKKDSSITEMEMIPARVSDILHYWSQCKDLECLKDMDRRFQEANILGKIANIIRQAHQRTSSSSRRPLAEFIAIPQYYPSGFLTLTKKC